MTRLLMDESPLQVLPTLATRIGLNEAIFAQQLHFWLLNPKMGTAHAGKKWIRNSIKEWRAENFPFWSTNTIIRTAAALIEAGIVETAKLRAAQGDMSIFYTINYPRLDEAILLNQDGLKRRRAAAKKGKKAAPTGQESTPDHLPNVADPFTQVEQMDLPKVGNSSIYTKSTYIDNENNARVREPENGFVSEATLALISGQSATLVLEPVQAVVKAAVTPKKKQAAPSVAFLAPATPAPAPATPAPTLYDTLPADDPRMAEHLRLLGMGANPKAERKARRDAKRAAAGMDLHVNDQGLTEALRAALVTELAKIRRMEALIGPNGHEDHLIKLQAQAERLWKLGVDTPEKMKALGEAWRADNKIVPRGSLLEEFQAELLSKMDGGAPAEGVKPNATERRGRGGHPSGQLAEWKRQHGPITAEPIPDRIVKQWHPDDRVAYYTEWRAAYDAAQPAPEWDTEMPDLPKWYADELRAKAAGATPSDAG